MIVKDTATIQKHISVNANVEFDIIKPNLKAAERKLLKPIIGKEQLEVFATIGENDSDELKEARELAEEAICNYGYYLNLPVGSVQIGDAGIMVPVYDNAKPISDKQFKELQRSFKTLGHEALDELLEFMEESDDEFSEWKDSDNYSVYNDLLVNSTSTFNKYFYIFNSRQTFISLRPTLKIVEDQFISEVIGSELLKALKDDQDNENRIKVKELLQKSIVAFTVMKTLDGGMLVLDAKGIHMRFDELPYEKTVTNTNKKVNDLLIRTRNNKETEGNEYLKSAKKLIISKADDFEEYTVNVVERKSGLKVTKSTVGF